MDNHIFDVWANGYDEDVDITDNKDEYPFAGYKKIMQEIYDAIPKDTTSAILDIGIGTGTLSSQLYARGNKITGVDFSQKMLDEAKKKMPNAKLISFDFTKGLPCEITKEKFDFIISTYALHHLRDDEKIKFIRLLLEHIDNGCIIVGDVSFQSRHDLEKCKLCCGEYWDDDEFYFVFSEIKDALGEVCSLIYRQISHCGGIMEIRKQG